MKWNTGCTFADGERQCYQESGFHPGVPTCVQPCALCLVHEHTPESESEMMVCFISRESVDRVLQEPILTVKAFPGRSVSVVGVWHISKPRVEARVCRDTGWMRRALLIWVSLRQVCGPHSHRPSNGASIMIRMILIRFTLNLGRHSNPREGWGGWTMGGGEQNEGGGRQGGRQGWGEGRKEDDRGQSKMGDGGRQGGEGRNGKSKTRGGGWVCMMDGSVPECQALWDCRHHWNVGTLANTFTAWFPHIDTSPGLVNSRDHPISYHFTLLRTTIRPGDDQAEFRKQSWWSWWVGHCPNTLNTNISIGWH